MNRSNRPEVFRKKGVLKNSAKTLRKTPVPESFLIARLRPATLLKKRLAKFLRTPFRQNNCCACFCMDKTAYATKPVKCSVQKTSLRYDCQE